MDFVEGARERGLGIAFLGSTGVNVHFAAPHGRGGLQRAGARIRGGYNCLALVWLRQDRFTQLGPGRVTEMLIERVSERVLRLGLIERAGR